MSNPPQPATPPDTSPQMPINTPQVSVLIPAFNAQRYLEETLRSVQAQTFTNWECVIVDDGSTDDTPRLLAEFAAREPRAHIVRQQNGGVVAARNRGFAEANPDAPFVAYLDNDDVWEPNALETLLGALEANPNAPAAHGTGRYIDADGRVMNDHLERSTRHRLKFDGRHISKCSANDATSFEVVATGQPLATPGMVMIRRSALERVGGFELACNPSDDWDLWARLTRLAPMAFVDTPIIQYRKHDGAVSTKMLRMTRSAALVRHRIVNSPENTPSQRAFALRAYRAFYFYSARSRLRAFFIVLLRERRFKAAAILLAQTLVNTLMALRGRP